VNIRQEREALKKRLQSKEHRIAFVSATVAQTIPLQMRALRLSKYRNWTQKQLSQIAQVKQSWVSNCENPKYDKFSVRTLKKFAAAFDVGLVVRFVPFSELVESEVNMSEKSLEVPNFENEKDYFKETCEPMEEAYVPPPPGYNKGLGNNITYMADYIGSRENKGLANLGTERISTKGDTNEVTFG
jgi:transcriptional regulator with XRE-family HTH domain